MACLPEAQPSRPQPSASGSSGRSTATASASQPSSSTGEAGRSGEEDTSSRVHQASGAAEKDGVKACATCGATETPMWRNGAAGPKTLCNACGVKYQRRMHKQKVAAEAAAAVEAATAAAGGGEDGGEIGSRLNRTCSGALRTAAEISGPPVLTRRSCNKAEEAAPAPTAAAADAAVAGRATAAGVDCCDGDGGMAARRPVSGDVKARKARRLADAPARRSHSPQTTSVQTTFAAGSPGPAAAAPMYGMPSGSPAAAACGGRGSKPAAAAPTAPATAAPASSADVPHSSSSGMTRLDGLQMQMAGRGGLPITIPQVTVLLQPVTRAQSLWTGSTDRTPSVALCAYDSSGSFLAAAPNIPDAAVAWSFPTSTSAAWTSGHSWALLFTQQAQHDAFRALLVEWQAATKARQSLSADAKTSSDDSGASAETDTSRAFQTRQHSRQTRPASSGRKRTVNCIRAVSDAVPISGQRSTADMALAAAASPKRPCSLSRSLSRGAGLANWPQPPPLAPASQHIPGSAPSPSVSAVAAPAGGGPRRFGSSSFTDSHTLALEPAPALGCVAEDRECLSPVEMEMAATLGSQSERLTHLPTGDDAAGGIPPSRSNVSLGGMRISRSTTGLRAGTHGFSAPAVGPLLTPMSPTGSGYTSYAQHVGPNSASGAPTLMSLGSADGWKGPPGHASNRSSADWSPQMFGGVNSGGAEGGNGAPCGGGLPMQSAGQPYGSVGGESDMSAATGYTQLSRRFGSMHVASSDSLSDMAYSRGSAATHFTGSAHGLNHSGMDPNAAAAPAGSQPMTGPAGGQRFADTEARVRAGQMFSGTSFASMAPVAAAPGPAVMRMPPAGAGTVAPPRHRHTGSCSLLDELDLEMDPLDPRFLAQVMAPSEAAVRGGSAAHALLHGEEPLHIGPGSKPLPTGFEQQCLPPSSGGHADMHRSNGFHKEGPQPPALLHPAKSSPEDWLLSEAAMPMVSVPDFFPESSFCMPQQGPPQQLQLVPQAQQRRFQQQPAPGQQAAGAATPLPTLQQQQQQQAPTPTPNQQAQQLQPDVAPYTAATEDSIADLLGCDWLLDPEATAADARALGSAPPLAPESHAAEWEGTVQRAAAALQEDSFAPWMPPRTASGSELGAGPVLQGGKANHLMRPPPAKVAV